MLQGAAGRCYCVAMRRALVVSAVVLLLMAAVVFAVSTSSVHEVLAATCVLAACVCLAGRAVVAAIDEAEAARWQQASEAQEYARRTALAIERMAAKEPQR